MSDYSNALEQALAQKATQTAVVRLASVTSVTNKKARVTFYGESTSSSTTYPVIDGYIPVVGDKVAMLPQGDSYIILGKVVDSSTDVTEYATKEGLDDAVDDIVDGTTTAAKATHATHAEKLADSTAKAISAGDTDTPVYFDSSGVPVAVKSIDASLINGAVGSATVAAAIQSAKNGPILYWSSKALIANQTAISFGSVKYPWYIYAERLYTPTSGYDHYVNISSGSSGMTFRPHYNKYWHLGTASYQLGNIYADAIYQAGSAVSTSDKRKKKKIKPLAQKYIDLLKRLRPVSYLFKDGNSGRTHTGLIAQEVEEAMHDSGIENKDWGGLVIQKNEDGTDGSYGLRYEELIAPMIAVIQDLDKRVEILERRLKDGK